MCTAPVLMSPLVSGKATTTAATHTDTHTRYSHVWSTNTFKHIHTLLPPRHNQTNINVEHEMCCDPLVQRWTGKQREQQRSCQTSFLCSAITSTPTERTRRGTGKYCWAFISSVQQRALERYAPYTLTPSHLYVFQLYLCWTFWCI